MLEFVYVLQKQNEEGDAMNLISVHRTLESAINKVYTMDQNGFFMTTLRYGGNTSHYYTIGMGNLYEIVELGFEE